MVCASRESGATARILMHRVHIIRRDTVCDGTGHHSPNWCKLFADDRVLCNTRREQVERSFEE